MRTPANRSAASGERTSATDAPSPDAEMGKKTRKRSKLNRRVGMIVARTLAAGTSLWGAFGAAPVQASDINASSSDRLATSVVEAGIGTLPLLAAMGVGIVVSVAAVIAFLQMTAKNKGSADEPEEIWEEGAGTGADGWSKDRRDSVEDESAGSGPT
ncbi:hypothetical protein [Cohnella fermenti]|uniref:Uncharacterized protein n=1 Tax=Cohnella fermenti TaxID=2565925 RepID=A0A4S4BSK9_9BACL|nr:hypothetical protein [Cohnella fermenti]THF77998.1 hypothetical protein E6C55_14935 [Cohnella fermenti]